MQMGVLRQAEGGAQAEQDHAKAADEMERLQHSYVEMGVPGSKLREEEPVMVPAQEMPQHNIRQVY